MNTFLAAAAAGLAWVVVEWVRDGKPTNLGAASGIVAGLVAITPAAGYVSGTSPIFIGLAAGVICCYAVKLKNKAGLRRRARRGRRALRRRPRRLAAIGFFANPDFFEGSSAYGPFKEGLFYGGGLSLLGEQILANGAAIVWSFAMTFGIMIALKNTIGVRVSAKRPRSPASTCPSTPRRPTTERHRSNGTEPKR